MRNQKGITLITLVITIIVLIILAGISINTLVGENGIITRAKQAKQNAELAQIEEAEQLNALYAELGGDYTSSGDQEALATLQAEYDNFRRTIAMAITNKGVLTEATDSAETMADNIDKIPSTAQNISIAQSVTATGGGYDIANAGYTESIVIDLEGFSTITFSSLSNMSSISCNGTNLGDNVYDISGLTSVTITGVVSTRQVVNNYGGIRYGSITGSYIYTLQKASSSGKINSIRQSVTATGGGYDVAYVGFSQSAVINVSGFSKITIGDLSNMSSVSCNGTSLGNNEYDVSELSSTTVSGSVSTRQVVDNYGGVRSGSITGAYTYTFE